MANKPTQKQALLKLLLKGKPVDHHTAERLTGCTTIRSRVSEFIQAGFKIDKERVNHTTRYKTTGQHVVYTMDLKHAKKNKLI